MRLSIYLRKQVPLNEFLFILSSGLGYFLIYLLDRLGYFSIYVIKNILSFCYKNILSFCYNYLEKTLINKDNKEICKNSIYILYKNFSTKMLLTGTVILTIYLFYIFQWVPNLYINYELDLGYLNISNSNTEIMNINYFLILINIIHIFIACYSLCYDYFFKKFLFKMPFGLYLITLIILNFTLLELSNLC